MSALQGVASGFRLSDRVVGHETEAFQDDSSIWNNSSSFGFPMLSKLLG